MQEHPTEDTESGRGKGRFGCQMADSRYKHVSCPWGQNEPNGSSGEAAEKEDGGAQEL